jgi:hypothetical protein
LTFIPVCSEIEAHVPFALGLDNATLLAQAIAPTVVPASENVYSCMTSPQGDKLDDTRQSISSCFQDLMPKSPTEKTNRGLTTEGIPACNVGTPCRDFNIFVDNGDFGELIDACDFRTSWDTVVNQNLFITSSEATLNCQSASDDDYCVAVDNSESNSTNRTTTTWTVPMSSSALYNNALLGYTLGNIELLAQMPGCRLPVRASPPYHLTG